MSLERRIGLAELILTARRACGDRKGRTTVRNGVRPPPESGEREIHYQTTGPELSTEGRIDMLVSGVGTGERSRGPL